VQKVRGRLIAHGVPLAKRAAKKYYGVTADLEQEAMVGLIRAVDTYDSSKRASFKTWVAVKVRGAILDATRKGTVVAEGLDVPQSNGLTLEETTAGEKDAILEGPVNLSYAVDAILDSMPGQDAFILEASAGLLEDSAGAWRKRQRARIAAVTDLTVREVATELQRIKRGLRKNLRVLALKKAARYVTVAERKAQSAERLARLPQHPPAPGGIAPVTPGRPADLHMGGPPRVGPTKTPAPPRRPPRPTRAYSVVAPPDRPVLHFLREVTEHDRTYARTAAIKIFEILEEKS
jgi:RNA polymerase sigma factor (sigma-70 family)